MMPPLSPPQLVGGKDNTHSTSAVSSPTLLAHAIYRALEACVLSDQPLPAGGTASKEGKGDGGDDNGNAGTIGQ
jgi:hypothetical protein